MKTTVIAPLEEQRRDALVAYYLGQIVPTSATAAPANIVTPEDLYEYLLIDNQISANVDTSRVAQGIASIQQYIHAIYNGMEPGYTNGFDKRELDLWRDGMSQYSTWAGYQMLEDYPENYIDPTLRLTKTEQFKELELDLGQSRITEDSVQSALKSYLTKFELVSNLKIVSGYIDGIDFKKADYYFVGRQNVEPFAHYWRKASIDVKATDTKVSPAIWSEWKKIDAAFSGEVTHARAVVVDGRLHLVWVESGEPEVNEDGTKTGDYFYVAKMAYKQLNDMWSPVTTLYKKTTPHKSLKPTLDSNGNFVSGFALVATMDVRRPSDPRLVVCFQWLSSAQSLAVAGTSNEGFVVSYDKLFNEVVDESEKNQIYTIASAMLGNNLNRMQFPYATDGAAKEGDLFIESVRQDDNPQYNYRPIGHITQSFDLTAKLSTYSNKASLRLQALTSAKVQVRSKLYLALTALPWNLDRRVDDVTIFSLRCAIVTEGDKQYAKILMHMNKTKWLDITATFKHLGVTIGAITLHDFDPPVFVFDGWTRTAKKLLSINKMSFPSLTPTEMQDAKGFELQIGFSGYPVENVSLKNPGNVMREEWNDRACQFRLWHRTPTTEPVLWRGNLVLNGKAYTPFVDFNLANMSPGVYGFIFGVSTAVDNKIGWSYYTVNVVRKANPIPVPVVVTTPDNAQFLDLDGLGLPDLSRYVRLNTLFGTELAKKVQFSLSSVLGWESQHTLEPPAPVPGITILPADFSPSRANWNVLSFDGANARYLWEIFFHVPHLVAHRLNSEFDYVGAENWLHHIFNPLARMQPLDPAPNQDFPYWTSRPLTGPDSPDFELVGLGDPDAIAYSVPSHYRKTIVMFYINNLIARGDMLYRQLTRDTLNEAKLVYVRALSLLGPLSKGRSLSYWTPMTLVAAASKGSAFATFQTDKSASAQPVYSVQAKGEPWLRLLDATWFRLPVNTHLLDLWDQLDLRLSNLRHNLSLDGKPLSLALYEAPANPLDLLRAQSAGGGSGQRRLGSMVIIPPYRFRAMLPRVQNAVDTLIRYGDQVRVYMEMRDRANQEELQQSHVLELSTFAQQLQEQALEQSLKSTEALRTSRATVQSRMNYYSGLVEEDVSSAEKTSMVMNGAAGALNTQSLMLSAHGHLISATTPTIGGAAFGGQQAAGAAFCASSSLQGVAQILSMASDVVATSEAYRRRRDEWAFLAQQAEQELAAIDVQIELQDLATQSARTSQAQASKAQQQAQDYYSFLKNRATGPALYQWLLSQMATLYFQAYDAVLSMCLSTEACWQYEIGDRDTRFIPTTAWADNYHGLIAGESLKLGLLRMESAYLNRHERRLELTKTVSLKQLFALETGEYPQGRSWSEVVAQYLGQGGNGSLDFQLKASTFDRDYPGHYLRQLVSVSVTLPAVVGAYQDIRATLMQQTSSTLMKPVIGGVKQLYKNAGELPADEDDDTVETSQIMFNPRAYQQIGISRGIDDNGMFSMDFGDERYYPFEGTGAISTWKLSFPRHTSKEQAAMIASLTDIIVHVRYLAVDGGQAFQQSVESLLGKVESSTGAAATKLLN